MSTEGRVIRPSPSHVYFVHIRSHVGPPTTIEIAIDKLVYRHDPQRQLSLVHVVVDAQQDRICLDVLTFLCRVEGKSVAGGVNTDICTAGCADFWDYFVLFAIKLA